MGFGGGPPCFGGHGCFLAFAFAGIDLGLCRSGFAFVLGAALGQAGLLGRRFLLFLAAAFVLFRLGLGGASVFVFLAFAFAGVDLGLCCCGFAFFLGAALGQAGLLGRRFLLFLALAFVVRRLGFGSTARLFVGPALIGRLPLGVLTLVLEALRLRFGSLVAGGCLTTLSGDRRRLERNDSLERRVLCLLRDRDPAHGAKRLGHTGIERATHRHGSAQPVELTVLDGVLDHLAVFVGSLPQHRDAEPVDEVEALLRVEACAVDHDRGPGGPWHEQSVPDRRRRAGSLPRTRRGRRGGRRALSLPARARSA